MGFLDDFKQLAIKLPRPPINSLSNENSPYVNSIHVIKNCYYCFDGGLAEDSAYCQFPYKIQDCFDCDYTFESELSYECIDCQNCYNCGYCEDCHTSRDLRFCFFCRDCHDCFGCVGLQHESYCVFNKKYSQSEYLKKIKELQRLPVAELKSMLNALKKDYPRASVHNVKSQNCPYGNFVTNCANCYWIFDGVGDEDSAYLVQSKFCKDCFDLHQSYKSELCYEGHIGISYNSSHGENCTYLNNCHFMFNCNHCDHCWGCANLNNARYCILNKEYSKNDYFKKVAKLRKELGWPKPQS